MDNLHAWDVDARVDRSHGTWWAEAGVPRAFTQRVGADWGTLPFYVSPHFMSLPVNAGPSSWFWAQLAREEERRGRRRKRREKG